MFGFKRIIKGAVFDRGEYKMYCSKCGKEVQEDAMFCPACGKSVSSGLEETNMRQVVLNSKYIKLGVITFVIMIVLLLVGMSIKNMIVQNSSDAPINPDNETSYSRVQCMACNGTGKVTCSSCLGWGTETLIGTGNASNGWLGEKRTCRAGCDGTGKLSCEYCNGTGWR